MTTRTETSSTLARILAVVFLCLHGGCGDASEKHAQAVAANETISLHDAIMSLDFANGGLSRDVLEGIIIEKKKALRRVGIQSVDICVSRFTEINRLSRMGDSHEEARDWLILVAHLNDDSNRSDQDVITIFGGRYHQVLPFEAVQKDRQEEWQSFQLKGD